MTNIPVFKRPEPGIVVEDMSEDDIAKYFPEHVRAEMTGRFKLSLAEDDASVILDRAANRLHD